MHPSDVANRKWQFQNKRQTFPAPTIGKQSPNLDIFGNLEIPAEK